MPKTRVIAPTKTERILPEHFRCPVCKEYWIEAGFEAGKPTSYRHEKTVCYQADDGKRWTNQLKWAWPKIPREINDATQPTRTANLPMHR